MVQVRVTEANYLIIGGRHEIYLSKMEANFMRAILSSNKVTSRNTLANFLFDGREDIDTGNNIDVYACKVRKKLPKSHKGLIVTARGRGYMLSVEYSYEPEFGKDLVVVDRELLNDVSFASGKAPETVIHDLLKREKQRLWQ